MASQDAPPSPTGPRKKGKVSKKWTQAEVDALQAAITAAGGAKAPDDMNWTEIALSVPGRTSKQCREKFKNDLKPGTRKEAWVPREEYILARAHSVFGNQWAEIARYLQGRSENSIKNHWNATLRSKAPARTRTFLGVYGAQTLEYGAARSAFQRALHVYEHSNPEVPLDQFQVPESFFIQADAGSSPARAGLRRVVPPRKAAGKRRLRDDETDDGGGDDGDDWTSTTTEEDEHHDSGASESDAPRVRRRITTRCSGSHASTHTLVAPTAGINHALRAAIMQHGAPAAAPQRVHEPVPSTAAAPSPTRVATIEAAPHRTSGAALPDVANGRAPPATMYLDTSTAQSPAKLPDLCRLDTEDAVHVSTPSSHIKRSLLLPDGSLLGSALRGGLVTPCSPNTANNLSEMLIGLGADIEAWQRGDVPLQAHDLPVGLTMEDDRSLEFDHTSTQVDLGSPFLLPGVMDGQLTPVTWAMQMAVDWPGVRAVPGSVGRQVDGGLALTPGLHGAPCTTALGLAPHESGAPHGSAGAALGWSMQPTALLHDGRFAGLGQH